MAAAAAAAASTPAVTPVWLLHTLLGVCTQGTKKGGGIYITLQDVNDKMEAIANALQALARARNTALPEGLTEAQMKDVFHTPVRRGRNAKAVLRGEGVEADCKCPVHTALTAHNFHAVYGSGPQRKLNEQAAAAAEKAQEVAEASDGNAAAVGGAKRKAAKNTFVVRAPAFHLALRFSGPSDLAGNKSMASAKTSLLATLATGVPFICPHAACQDAKCYLVHPLDAAQGRPAQRHFFLSSTQHAVLMQLFPVVGGLHPHALIRHTASGTDVLDLQAAAAEAQTLLQPVLPVELAQLSTFLETTFKEVPKREGAPHVLAGWARSEGRWTVAHVHKAQMAAVQHQASTAAVPAEAAAAAAASEDASQSAGAGQSTVRRRVGAAAAKNKMNELLHKEEATLLDLHDNYRAADQEREQEIAQKEAQLVQLKRKQQKRSRSYTGHVQVQEATVACLRERLHSPSGSAAAAAAAAAAAGGGGGH